MTGQVLVFGGSFDPVHHGHLIVARAVAERCGFERVTLVPTGRPPHKRPPVAPAETRLEMLRSAVGGKPMFDICELELRRAGPGYTIDTIGELRRLHGEAVDIHWIIGADLLEDLHLWHRASDVLEAARLRVALRPPWDSRLDEILAGMRKHFSADQVDRIAGDVVSSPLIDISSREIRRRVASGLPIDFLVPEAVLAVISRTRVYGNLPREK